MGSRPVLLRWAVERNRREAPDDDTASLTVCQGLGLASERSGSKAERDSRCRRFRHRADRAVQQTFRFEHDLQPSAGEVGPRHRQTPGAEVGRRLRGLGRWNPASGEHLVEGHRRKRLPAGRRSESVSAQGAREGSHWAVPASDSRSRELATARPPSLGSGSAES
jgi:hypothetical protein